MDSLIGANGQDLFLGKLSARIFFSSKPHTATFEDFVVRIVLLRSEKKVKWINAFWGVAAVQNKPPVWNIFDTRLENEPMGALLVKETVSIFILPALPQPAFCSRIDPYLRKEALKWRALDRHALCQTAPTTELLL